MHSNAFAFKCNLYRYSEVVKRDARHTWVYNVAKSPVASPLEYTSKIESKPAKSNNQPHLSSWIIDNAPGSGWYKTKGRGS